MILRWFEAYLDFSGRMNRKQYIISIIMTFLGMPFCVYIAESDFLYDFLSFVIALIGILFFISYLSITAKRLHDLNASGWWQLIINFIPFGQVLLIGLLFFKGTEGANRYGEPPTN